MKTEEAQLLGADRADSVEVIKAAVTGYEIDTTQYEAKVNAATAPESIAAIESAALKEIAKLKELIEKAEMIRLICIVVISVVALGDIAALAILYIEHKKNKNKDQVNTPDVDNINTSTLTNIERKPYKPFVDRIAEANELTQEFYSTIKNELLSYEKIKSRISKRGESFSLGNAVQAKLRMTGKTLKLFLALDPNEFDKNIYHHEDVSDKKAFEQTPLLIRLRSRRAVKYAITLIAMLMEKSNVAKKPLDETKVVENLSEVKDEVSVDDTNIQSFPTIERKPFKPYANRIMEASELTQEFYSTIKNELLSYRKMKSRISKRGESFRIGRTLQAKLVLTGKTMKLFLALDPNEFDQNIYFHKDASDKKAYEQTPLLIRLRSRRAVKHALALITKMMENNNVLKKSKHEVKDYIKELGNIIE